MLRLLLDFFIMSVNVFSFTEIIRRIKVGNAGVVTARNISGCRVKLPFYKVAIGDYKVKRIIVSETKKGDENNFMYLSKGAKIPTEFLRFVKLITVDKMKRDGSLLYGVVTLKGLPVFNDGKWYVFENELKETNISYMLEEGYIREDILERGLTPVSQMINIKRI